MHYNSEHPIGAFIMIFAQMKKVTKCLIIMSAVMNYILSKDGFMHNTT